MSMTLRQAFDGSIPTDEMDLAVVSDALWQIGSLEDIRLAVSPALFAVHVGMNVIGSWKGDGWHEIISDQPSLLPHIHAAMESLGLAAVAAAVRDVLSVFPEFVSFSEDGFDPDLHCDAVNFLANPRFTVADERFSRYDKEQRTAMCKRYRDRLDALEKTSESLWLSGASDDDGWKAVLEYVRRNFEE